VGRQWDAMNLKSRFDQLEGQLQDMNGFLREESKALAIMMDGAKMRVR
jgi:hypothetical protein